MRHAEIKLYYRPSPVCILYFGRKKRREEGKGEVIARRHAILLHFYIAFSFFAPPIFGILSIFSPAGAYSFFPSRSLLAHSWLYRHVFFLFYSSRLIALRPPSLFSLLICSGDVAPLMCEQLKRNFTRQRSILCNSVIEIFKAASSLSRVLI